MGLWVYPCAMRGNWGNDGERWAETAKIALRGQKYTVFIGKNPIKKGKSLLLKDFPMMVGGGGLEPPKA